MKKGPKKAAKAAKGGKGKGGVKAKRQLKKLHKGTIPKQKKRASKKKY